MKRLSLIVSSLLSMLACMPASADLLVSSKNTNSVLVFDDQTGAYIKTLLGPSDGLNGPVGLRLGPDGDLYIGNQDGGFISKYDFATQTISTFAANPFDPSVPYGPTDIYFAPNGDLVTSNFFGDNLVKFSSTGSYLGNFSSGGTLSQPTFMLPQGNTLYVSSLGTNEVQTFNATTGAYLSTFITGGNGNLQFPAGLAFGPNGNFFVASLLGQQVLEYNGTTGAFVGNYLNFPTFPFPSDLLFRPDGSLLISTTFSQGVLRYDGTNLTTFASNPDLQIGGQFLIVPSAIPEASTLALLTAAGGIVVASRRWKVLSRSN